jgi:hypothetical protein
MTYPVVRVRDERVAVPPAARVAAPLVERVAPLADRVAPPLVERVAFAVPLLAASFEGADRAAPLPAADFDVADRAVLLPAADFDVADFGVPLLAASFEGADLAVAGFGVVAVAAAVAGILRREGRPGRAPSAGRAMAAHACASSFRVSPKSCGTVLVRPITGMKFVSPPHRGTTC